MNTIEQAKKQVLDAQAALLDAAHVRAEKLLKSRKYKQDFKALNDVLTRLEADPYSKEFSQGFDEGGFLEACVDVSLSFLSEEPHEVINAVVGILMEDSVLNWSQDQYSRGITEWRVSYCLGEPTTIDPNPERNCFAVYSSELGLKISRIESLEHGLALIEQAMRKAGMFGDIVRVDRYGQVLEFLSTDLGNKSDAELAELIEQFETQE